MEVTNDTGDLMNAAEVCSNDEHPVADAATTAITVSIAIVLRRTLAVATTPAVIERDLIIVGSKYSNKRAIIALDGPVSAEQ